LAWAGIRVGGTEVPQEDWTVVKIRREVHEVVLAAAEEAGKSLHEWLRDAVLAAADRKDPGRGASIGNCLIGKSLAMQQVLSIIKRVGAIRTNVMIYGKRGTEKSEVAEAIHDCSPRASKPFLDISCSGLAEHQLDAELFGHERGSSADAKALKRGLLEKSDGGTLFVEEIGDMPLVVQHRFTRFLESRSFRRIGGTQDISVDVRVIAGTDRDLKQGVEEGTFREDLYYRMNVVPITLPDLKDRQEDIPVLAMHFLRKFAQESNPAISEISREAMGILQGYQWPGNVRELENVIERAVALGHPPAILLANLPPHLADGAGPVQEALAREATLEDLEREYIKAVLRRTHGHQVRAAAILGIDRRTLYRKIRQYDLKLGSK
jgi:DNA-binding NtrC family response regulator